ncbi:MAG TPA: TIM barrel protein [bacterium]|nr:TIM barrel protein [bacterium]HOL50037.1 TIM barrel protein [bacterium]HPO51773.1 TIM barrel protein [bacterium]
MRLGGPVLQKFETPEEWVKILKRNNYSAAYCPTGLDAPDELVKEFKKMAEKESIVIAEVGAWSNPISGDENERRQAIEKCKRALYLAEKINARCCVNISGSRGSKWDGPDEKNFTDETFDMIVMTTREIIDEIKPERTFYTLETMPWMYPDSAESYLRLIKAIDRESFGVHFDPVNLVCSPQRYFSNEKLIKEFVKILGIYICSCHAKDIILTDKLTVHLEEVRPGLGKLDYRVFLNEINKIGKDTPPVMLEHLRTEEDYVNAAQYIRTVASQEGIKLL